MNRFTQIYNCALYGEFTENRNSHDSQFSDWQLPR